MKRCTHCDKGGALVSRTAENSREVGGHLFVAFLPAEACTSCGKVYFESNVLERFELHVAGKLADAGVSTGPAFRFMRKALGMRATDLAALLDVSAETISRWETEKRGVDRGALALVGALVRDTLEGRTSTLQQLRALREPHPLAKTIQLDLSSDFARSA
jgi:DNA-binding transcriptional regulator YiaG